MKKKDECVRTRALDKPLCDMSLANLATKVLTGDLTCSFSHISQSVLLRGLLYDLAFNCYNYSASEVFIYPGFVDSCFPMVGSAKGTNKTQPSIHTTCTHVFNVFLTVHHELTIH